MVAPKEQHLVWKRNRREWIKALRSGRFKQCKRALHNGEGYSALGVLCVLAGVHPEQLSGVYYFDHEYWDAPEVAADYVGLTQPHGLYRDNRGNQSLRDKNDDGWTFERIAQLIEGKPNGLFRPAMVC